ncbi:dephospho-CoA kinase [Kangiella shandongensis]|uniref:dephospho-CoA kinase n=1 Tax=Kangiella shandongensis TaxID=2763258 RepID=UPI001CC11471|nr:dephospho-CoA kinase [Kangiella shandongensis]
MTLHIALTGGVASGKSAVSRYFEELGVPVLDADQVARDVVAIGSQGLLAITEKFGEEVLQADGTLDRRALRNIVFTDDDKLKWLNQLLHPLIRQQMTAWRAEAAKNQALYTISAIPLYYETIYNTPEAEQYDRVVVIDASEDIQLERLMQRDDSSVEQAKALISSQAGREERLAIADDVITNDADLQSLKQQVIKLDNEYRDLARS